MNICNEVWAIKMKCTQYAIYGQAAVKFGRTILFFYFFCDSSGVDNNCSSRSNILIYFKCRHCLGCGIVGHGLNTLFPHDGVMVQPTWSHPNDMSSSPSLSLLGWLRFKLSHLFFFYTLPTSYTMSECWIPFIRCLCS